MSPGQCCYWLPNELCYRLRLPSLGCPFSGLPRDSVTSIPIDYGIFLFNSGRRLLQKTIRSFTSNSVVGLPPYSGFALPYRHFPPPHANLQGQRRKDSDKVVFCIETQLAFSYR